MIYLGLLIGFTLGLVMGIVLVIVCQAGHDAQEDLCQNP